ncbi:RNA polymerase subunit sigma [Sporosarcina sp. P19]|uniref:RNA polymerase subunit sigma n=1 Tax=Sporosarcina sp. P19 TaxID=2048258 RepID=UPI001E2BF47E|nr:RNA polymerase subunit sigma [Sporosarcina sp. P19]
MSLKAIELQIAIPKTFEAGKIAEQKQQQSQLAQDVANMQTEKQTLNSRETVMKSDPYAKLDGDGRQPDDESQRHLEKIEKEQQQAKHPFKGSFVDYSG